MSEDTIQKNCVLTAWGMEDSWFLHGRNREPFRSNEQLAGIVRSNLHCGKPSLPPLVFSFRCYYQSDNKKRHMLLCEYIYNVCNEVSKGVCGIAVQILTELPQ
jgi:hypothetical protein